MKMVQMIIVNEIKSLKNIYSYSIFENNFSNLLFSCSLFFISYIVYYTNHRLLYKWTVQGNSPYINSVIPIMLTHFIK